MPYINVEVDLDQFTTDELIEELNFRGPNFTDDPVVTESLTIIYNHITCNTDYTKELNNLIYYALGRIV